MTAEESKDSANGDKLAANVMATDMYSWLMSSGETSMFLDINGRSQKSGNSNRTEKVNKGTNRC
jgi:hypothetical protein